MTVFKTNEEYNLLISEEEEENVDFEDDDCIGNVSQSLVMKNMFDK